MSCKYFVPPAPLLSWRLSSWPEFSQYQLHNVVSSPSLMLRDFVLCCYKSLLLRGQPHPHLLHLLLHHQLCLHPGEILHHSRFNTSVSVIASELFTRSLTATLGPSALVIIIILLQHSNSTFALQLQTFSR